MCPYFEPAMTFARADTGMHTLLCHEVLYTTDLSASEEVDK